MGGDTENGSVFSAAIGTYDKNSFYPMPPNCLLLSSKGKLKMPTTIQFVPSTGLPPRWRTTKPDLFYTRADFGILILWAFAMLLIGAAAHFGAQSSEFSALESLALF